MCAVVPKPSYGCLKNFKTYVDKILALELYPLIDEHFEVDEN